MAESTFNKATLDYSPYEPEKLITTKQMLLHMPWVCEIVKVLPDSLIDLLVAPFSMMAPIYGILYQLEHMIESIVEPLLFGGKTREDIGFYGRCMETRMDYLYEKYLLPMMAIIPGGDIPMRIFLSFHKIFCAFCPTYIMMATVSPEEFRKQKYWNFTIDDFDLPEIPCLGATGLPEIFGSKKQGSCKITEPGGPGCLGNLPCSGTICNLGNIS